MTRRTVALTLSLFLSACGGPRAPGGPTQTAASAASTPAEDAATGEALFGKPCAAPRGPAETCTLCDSHDRIAGVLMMGDLVHFDDSGAVFRRSPPPTDAASGKLAFTMAGNAESLRAQVLTCANCARQMGWGAVVSFASIKDLSPALRAELQVALGYPAAPLLDSPAAFKATTPKPPAASLACPDGIRR